jgi:DNA gyrase/topoisomerase IV subunit A
MDDFLDEFDDIEFLHEVEVDELVIVIDYIHNTNDLINIVDNFHSNYQIPKVILDTYKIDTDIKFIEKYKNTEYSLGDYTYNSKTNVIIITELPYSVTTSKYIESISKLENYISKIEDYSSTDEIDIKIYLHPDVIDIIQDKYGNDIIDSIQECFKLYTSLKPNLNYSYNNNVLEFDSDYIKVILYWLPERRDLYKQRVIRKHIILEIIILREESIIKYIELSNKLNIPKVNDEEKVVEILLQNNLPQINNTLLNSPMYTSNDKLRDLLLHSKDATFDYILNLKERELTKQAVNDRITKLNKIKEEYNKWNNYLHEKPFIGSSIWLEEIETLLKFINKK